MSYLNRVKNAAVSDFQSVEENGQDGEYSEIESEILAFCEKHAEKAKRLLNKTYQDGKDIKNIDHTAKVLKRLTPAKLALAQIIRAIKKRDYMLLQSETVPEIEQIKHIAPEITQFQEDLRNLRA